MRLKVHLGSILESELKRSELLKVASEKSQGLKVAAANSAQFLNKISLYVHVIFRKVDTFKFCTMDHKNFAHKQ